MTTPEVKVRATLNVDDIKTQVSTLAIAIQNQLSVAFTKAFTGDGVNVFANAVKSLTQASAQLESGLKKVNVTVKAYGNEVKDAEQKTDKFNKALAKLFASALKGSNASQKFAQSLLKQAAAAGAGSDVIESLAKSTNVFSDSQIRLASQIAKLQQEIKELSKDANDNEQAYEDLVKASKALIKAQVDLDRELDNTEKALKNSAEASKKLIELEKQLAATRSKTFASSLQAANAEQKFTQQMLKQVAATGVALPNLKELATASGTFSANELQAANSVAILTAELQKQSRAFDGTEAAQEELIATSRKLFNEQKNLASIQNKLNPNIGPTGQEQFFTGLQIGFAKLNNVTAGIRNIIDIIDKTLIQLFRTAKEGAVITQTANSFENFATNIAGIPDLLTQLDDAAKGTISTLKLQEQTLTLVAGLGPELSRTFSEALVGAGDFDTSLLDVARAAQILNPSLGDVDFFLKSLSIGIKRNERRWIDNLGIVISAREAYQRFAEANNVSVLELSATDKTIATLNETLRVGKLLIDQTGGSVDNLIDPFSRLETQVANLTDRFKELVAGGVLPYVELVSGTLNLNIADQLIGQLDRADNRVLASQELLRNALDIDIGTEELESGLGALSIFTIPGALGLGGLISKQVAEAQQEAISIALRELADDSGRQLQFTRSLSVVFGGDLDTRRDVIRDQLNLLKDEFGEEALREQGLEFDIFGNVSTDSLSILESAFFNLVVAQNQATEAADDGSLAILQQAQRFRELKVAIDDVAQEFAGGQIDIVQSLFGAGLEDAERQQFGRQLAESFRDQFVEGLRAGGFDEASITSIRTFLGEFDEGALEASKSTLELNSAIADLNFLLVRRGVTDPALISNAFTALELGFANSAVEALGLARNTEFVTNVLIPAREAALSTAEALDETADSTKAASEAVAELRDNLRAITEGGFDRARGAIEQIGEAQRGIAESAGERRTVQIDNSARISEIESELFADLPEDRQEELSDRLTELRENGGEFTDEYALILKEIAQDISQSERDALLVERFDLQQQQGDFLTAVFGRDPEALERFEEQQQEAIQELIENRRRTIAELLTEGREVDFETEVGLLVGLELIGDLEADLLIAERQIFNLIDQVFGSGAVFQVDGAVVDFGEIAVNEIPPEQIAELVSTFETAIDAGVAGADLQEVTDIVIKLALSGEIETEDVPSIIQGAIDALLGDPDATAEEAVIISVVPEVETSALVKTLDKMVKDFSSFGEDIPETVKKPVEAIQSVREAIDRVNEAIQVTEDNDEVEVTIIADTDEAVAAINSFLDIIPDEVKINITAEGAEDFRTPESGDIEGAGNVAPASGGSQSSNANRVFRQGGFTGTGNPSSAAGVVEFQEFVFNQQDVQSLGVDSLQSLRDGQASIVPTGSFPPDVVSSMLNAISSPTPTLSPAPITTNNTTNRTVSMDQSTTIVNNYFDRPRSGVSPVMDVIF